MIYFKQDLKDIALELIKLKDNADLLNDITDVSNHISALENYPTDEIVLLSAQKLDAKMQREYPIIGELINAGNMLANVLPVLEKQYTSKCDCVKSYLQQDMFGILCQALLKHKIINSCEHFIDRVDEI